MRIVGFVGFVGIGESMDNDQLRQILKATRQCKARTRTGAPCKNTNTRYCPSTGNWRVRITGD